jgi:hypothetical protein
MEAILLKSKNPCAHPDLVVFDELFSGVLNPEMWIPTFKGSCAGVHLIPLSLAIERYQWPAKDGIAGPRICHFMKGHCPSTVFEFYEDPSIIIE